MFLEKVSWDMLSIKSVPHIVQCTISTQASQTLPSMHGQKLVCDGFTLLET